MTNPNMDIGVITAGMADIAEAVGTVIDLVAGYRAKLELAGYSPAMAEAMSAQLHGMLLARMLGNPE